jgi:hypothetical protein
MSKAGVCIAAGAMVLAGASGAHAALMHQYTFEDGTANDSVGSAHGTLEGGATIVDGQVQFDGTDDYVNLPGSTIQVNTYSALTVELWLTSSSSNAGKFTMAAVFGRHGQDGDPNTGWGYQYLDMQPTRADGSGEGWATITDQHWNNEKHSAADELADDQPHHFLATVDGSSITLYIDGVQQTAGDLEGVTLGDLSNEVVYLARSVYGGDPYYAGSIDEFNIYSHAMSADDVAGRFAAGPTVPEPASAALIGLGSLALLVRRRCR